MIKGIENIEVKKHVYTHVPHTHISTDGNNFGKCGGCDYRKTCWYKRLKIQCLHEE